MELVYLWVDKYKNIKNQGFNFLPRFTCKYDEASKELTIDKKEHVSIFPENINVTAIVGENGSGKSNILNLIFNEHITTKVFFILRINEELKVYGIDLDSSTYLNNTIREEQLQDRVFKCSNLKSGRLDNYKLAFYTPLLQDSFTDNRHNYIEKKYNLSSVSLLDDYINNQQIYKNITFKNLYGIYESNSIQNSIDMIKNCQNLSLPFDIPTELTISVNKVTQDEEYSQEQEFLREKNPSENSFYGYVEQRAIKNWFSNSFYNFFEKSGDSPMHIFNEKIAKSDNVYNIDNLINIFNEETVGYDDNTIDTSDLVKELNDINEFLKLVKTISNVIEENSLKLKIEDIPNDFISKYNKVIVICSAFLDFSWKPQLSSGQQTFLSQFSLFYKYLKNNDNTLLLIDEGETTLHPNWQKRYIKYIIDFFQKNIKNKKLHVIFSSHSPFILSDLPKENVIFLDKFDDETTKKYPKLKINGLENGNCINVSKYIELNPFGANIHTLLSHGFFMKDGLMGEFAKEKIQSVIDFLNDVEGNELNRQKAWSIIEIIGEPFLKYKLKEKFHEKFSTDEEKRTAKIKQLEEELERLKNVKS